MSIQKTTKTAVLAIRYVGKLHFINMTDYNYFDETTAQINMTDFDLTKQQYMAIFQIIIECFLCTV